MDWNVRWMLHRDMSTVLGIEHESFDSPWTEEEFLRCLCSRNCIGQVAETPDAVVGFVVYELHKHRIRILNLAVAPQHRRAGAGSAMLRRLARKLSSDRRNRIVLEVRETNLPAQLFFKAAGYRAITVLKDWYDDSVEDAYLMQYRYAEHLVIDGEMA